MFCFSLNQNTVIDHLIYFVFVFKAWDTAEKSDYTADLIVSAERQFECCGLGIYDNYTLYEHPNEEDHDWSTKRNVFEQNDKCFERENADCFTCHSKISDKVSAGFHAAGGLGLFFSFPEVIIKFYFSIK